MYSQGDGLRGCLNVRATLAVRLAKRLSKIAVAERTAKAGKASGEARKTNMSDTSSDMLPKQKRRKAEKKDTRKAVAKKANVPERKLRTALAINKKAGKDAKAINKLVIAGTITLSEANKLASLPEDTSCERHYCGEVRHSPCATRVAFSTKQSNILRIAQK